MSPTGDERIMTALLLAPPAVVAILILMPISGTSAAFAVWGALVCAQLVVLGGMIASSELRGGLLSDWLLRRVREREFRRAMSHFGEWILEVGALLIVFPWLDQVVELHSSGELKNAQVIVQCAWGACLFLGAGLYFRSREE